MVKTWICISFILICISSLRDSPLQTMLMVEICDNAIDDDNDGLVDLNDPNCVCEVISQESLIPNPSFEELTCCPQMDSQLSCARGWNQASTATTDYVNTCGYMINDVLLPFPDGEGAAAFIVGSAVNDAGVAEIYKEYAGTCLNRPMLKDSIYRFKFHIGFLTEESSPDINFSFFGSPRCSNLPFTQGTDCPTNYPNWYLLQSEVVSRPGTEPGWVEVSTVIQPSLDINALVIGGDCNHDPELKLRVYFVDNLRLNDESSFDFELISEGSTCDPNFRYAVADNSSFSYQWYLAGVALPGETDYEMSQMYGEGAYQVRLLNNRTGQCRITDAFEFVIPKLGRSIYRTICKNERLDYRGDQITEPGIYDYDFISVEGCDSTITLIVEEEADITDTLFARILPGTSYTVDGNQVFEEGEHHFNLTTANGCDSTLVLYLDHINIYIPNSFSPNGDNINDLFEVYAAEEDFISHVLSIYDRWGNLIYTGDRWDGTFNNTPVNPGVYIYSIKLIDMDERELIISNSILVVR